MIYIILYHGSEQIVKEPKYGVGNKRNDYGQGFYLTKEKELAKEWSCEENRDGYINKYEIDIEGLKVLNLNSKEYNILHWLALLINNRIFASTSVLMDDAKRYILSNFLIDISSYDIVIGYRADDSYFSFAKDFLSNTISLEKLREAMTLGELGEQVFIKSKEAFERIKFIKEEKVDSKIYYVKKKNRDNKAREKYFRNRMNILDGLYVLDIIREGMTSDDKRLYL